MSITVRLFDACTGAVCDELVSTDKGVLLGHAASLLPKLMLLQQNWMTCDTALDMFSQKGKAELFGKPPNAFACTLYLPGVQYTAHEVTYPESMAIPWMKNVLTLL